ETIRDVTLDSSLETTTVPKLILPQDNVFLKLDDYSGYTVREVFLGVNETTKLLEYQTKGNSDITEKDIEVKASFQLKTYYLSVALRKPITYTRDDLFNNASEPLFQAKLRTNIIVRSV